MNIHDILGMVPDSVWEKQFKVGAGLPIGWKLTARQLKRLADIAYDVAQIASQKWAEHTVQEIVNMREAGESPDGTRVLSEEDTELALDMGLVNLYYMLVGLAIENLAKGLLVLRSPNYLNSKGEFRYKDHDLLKLIKDHCNVPLSVQEQDLLQTLTDFTVWKGRYIIPLKASDLHPPKRALDGNLVQPGTEMGGDHQFIESFYERLLQFFETEVANLKTSSSV